MITSNVFHRTLFIRYGSGTGTAFAIDIEKRQYLVTARHVVDGIGATDEIQLFKFGKWERYKTRLVGAGDADEVDADVCVIALDVQISPANLILPATSAGVIYGQSVFFLGFPYGLHTHVTISNAFPLPLIKGAIMSGSFGGEGQVEVFVLDGHNNPGFSGGPVVFHEHGTSINSFKVMGIVSGFKSEKSSITFQGKPTGLTSESNTGLVICPSIKQAVDMITANPIGFALG